MSDPRTTQPDSDPTLAAAAATTPFGAGQPPVPENGVSEVDPTGKGDVLVGQANTFGGAASGVDAEITTEAATTSGDVAITGKAALIVRRLFRNKGAILGLTMILLAVLFAIFGNMPNKWSYSDQDLLNLGTPPDNEHWFGTNVGGVDLYAMIVRGMGKSLLIAVVVGMGAPIIAAIYGTTIAFWGGRREKAGMWILDMLLLLPTFLLIAVLMGNWGGSAIVLAILLTLTSWMGMARVIRATSQSLREREYVQAARYMGVSDLQIIKRHIIPNIGSYLILQIVLQTFGAIIYETALSFLGVGVRPPDVSLGMLIGQSASQLSGYPWMFWAPTIALMWITCSLALLGDGLRDALDPNSKSGGRA